MHRITVCFLLLTFTLAACKPEGTSTALPTSAPPSVEVFLPTEAPTTSPTLTPPPSPAPTFTQLPPTATPGVPEAFYHLRIEISTTSDWAKVELVNPGHFLTARMIGTDGERTSADVGAA